MKDEDHFCILDINILALFDGKGLPYKSVADPKVIMYELVIRQECLDLIRINFDRTFTTQKGPTLTLNIFGNDVLIAGKFLEQSTKATYCRVDPDKEVYVHVYKVYHEKGSAAVGLVRHLNDHGKQDLPIHTFCLNKRMNCPGVKSPAITMKQSSKIEKAQPRFNMLRLMHTDKYRHLESLPIKKHSMTAPLWYTQKLFYGTCHASSSLELQWIDLKYIIVNFFETQSGTLDAKTFPMNLMESLKKFGAVFASLICYRDDQKFENPLQVDDFGDSKLEISYYGDCEDAAHMYSRNLRLLFNIFPWFLEKQSDLYKAFNELATNYTPLINICKVQYEDKETGELKQEYHSTMLLVPNNDKSKYKTISFEVTAPEKSSYLGIEENVKQYYESHINHYFLVDSEHVIEMDDLGIKIEDLAINNLIPHAINF
jgi:hypothetical protein